MACDKTNPDRFHKAIIRFWFMKPGQNVGLYPVRLLSLPCKTVQPLMHIGVLLAAVANTPSPRKMVAPFPDPRDPNANSTDRNRAL